MYMLSRPLSPQAAIPGSPTSPTTALSPPFSNVAYPPSTCGSYPLSDPLSPVKGSAAPWTVVERFRSGTKLVQPPLASSSVGSQEHIESTYLEISQQADPNACKKANLPWLGKDVVENRRITFGLAEEAAANFIKDCEFVSLGCFCGVTRALQCLGLKRLTYPFDWVRTNIVSTAACLQTDFRDFCTSTMLGESPAPGVQCRGGSRWGGSFWHHDPANPRVQQDFARRIERFRGKSEIAPAVTRIFCVSLNSLSDLASIPRLRLLLEGMLPQADIFLLVFIDNQPAKGLVRVDNDSNLLFYWIYQDMFEDMGRNRWSEQRHAESYAEGLVAALRVWSGADTGESVAEVASYNTLYVRCSNFDGGDPSRKLFWPMRRPNEPPLDISAGYPRCNKNAPKQSLHDSMGPDTQDLALEVAAMPSPTVEVIFSQDKSGAVPINASDQDSAGSPSRSAVSLQSPVYPKAPLPMAYGEATPTSYGVIGMNHASQMRASGFSSHTAPQRNTCPTRCGTGTTAAKYPQAMKVNAIAGESVSERAAVIGATVADGSRARARSLALQSVAQSQLIGTRSPQAPAPSVAIPVGISNVNTRTSVTLPGQAASIHASTASRRGVSPVPRDVSPVGRKDISSMPTDVSPVSKTIPGRSRQAAVSPGPKRRPAAKIPVQTSSARYDSIASGGSATAAGVLTNMGTITTSTPTAVR
jgi:hypothetical protein